MWVQVLSVYISIRQATLIARLEGYAEDIIEYAMLWQLSDAIFDWHSVSK